MASEALAIAEAARDRFSICVAREAVGGTLRRMMRLEEAERHLDDAVDGFRELGGGSSRARSRREGSRCASPARPRREGPPRGVQARHRAEHQGAAAPKQLDRGDTPGARRVLAEAAQVTNAGGPAPEEWLDYAGVEVLLAEGERDEALEKEILAYERKDGTEKDIAARVWWI